MHHSCMHIHLCALFCPTWWVFVSATVPRLSCQVHISVWWQRLGIWLTVVHLIDRNSLLYKWIRSEGKEDLIISWYCWMPDVSISKGIKITAHVTSDSDHRRLYYWSAQYIVVVSPAVGWFPMVVCWRLIKEVFITTVNIWQSVGAISYFSQTLWMINNNCTVEVCENTFNHNMIQKVPTVTYFLLWQELQYNTGWPQLVLATITLAHEQRAISRTQTLHDGSWPPSLRRIRKGFLLVCLPRKAVSDGSMEFLARRSLSFLWDK